MAALPRPSCFIAGFQNPVNPAALWVLDIFIKKRPIFDEMLQVLLSLKNSHLSAYKNCYDDINGSKVNLKD